VSDEGHFARLYIAREFWSECVLVWIVFLEKRAQSLRGLLSCFCGVLVWILKRVNSEVNSWGSLHQNYYPNKDKWFGEPSFYGFEN
jgi:hypothetical protein